jgi:hypothetical protein
MSVTLPKKLKSAFQIPKIKVDPKGPDEYLIGASLVNKTDVQLFDLQSFLNINIPLFLSYDDKKSYRMQIIITQDLQTVKIDNYFVDSDGNDVDIPEFDDSKEEIFTYTKDQVIELIQYLISNGFELNDVMGNTLPTVSKTKTIPPEFARFFLDKQIEIDSNGDKEFFIGFEFNQTNEEIEFLKDLLNKPDLDNDLNQIIINQDFKTITVEKNIKVMFDGELVDDMSVTDYELSYSRMVDLLKYLGASDHKLYSVMGIPVRIRKDILE